MQSSDRISTPRRLAKDCGCCEMGHIRQRGKDLSYADVTPAVSDAVNEGRLDVGIRPNYRNLERKSILAQRKPAKWLTMLF